MTEPDYGPEPSEPPTTVRLIFEYEGTDIRLISRRRVAMMPPPSDPLREREDAQGFWVEVRDAQQRPLYRRVMCDPVRRDVEVFSDEPEYSIARVPVDEPARPLRGSGPGHRECRSCRAHPQPVRPAADRCGGSGALRLRT
ncbi:hypothetical protein SGRIM128S_09626 [Streptomyces griseomycini]